MIFVEYLLRRSLEDHVATQGIGYKIERYVNANRKIPINKSKRGWVGKDLKPSD